MKEYTYSPELDVSDKIKEHEEKFHKGEEQEYEVEEDGCDCDESGGSRYKKNMISVTVHCTVRCLGEHEKGEGHLTDDVVDTYDLTDETNAGSFDELF